MPRIRIGNKFGGFGRGGVRRSMGRGSFGGGSTKMRLIIAVVVALVAVGGYFLNTQVNPFTEEEQRVSMSYEQETRLGLTSKPEMIQQMGGAKSQSATKSRVVEQVGRQLLDEGGVNEILRENDLPYQFSFTLLEDDQTVNAFALPGGPVFITEALYDDLENVAQLAGVIGHEIGHVIDRHGAQRMAKQQLTQGLAGAAAVGTGDAGAAQLAGFVGNFITMKYGREEELKSDDFGMKFMVKAGYDPREMVRVMEILKAASGGGAGGTPEFMQTHPHPESRIEAIQAYVRDEFPDGVPDTLTTGGELPR